MTSEDKVLCLKRYYSSRAETANNPLRFFEETVEGIGSFLLSIEKNQVKEGNLFLKFLREHFDPHVKALEVLIEQCKS